MRQSRITNYFALAKPPTRLICAPLICVYSTPSGLIGQRIASENRKKKNK